MCGENLTADLEQLTTDVYLLAKVFWLCRTNLHRKNVLPGATCQVCNEHDGTPEHVMGGCLLSTEFWQTIGIGAMNVTAMNNIHHNLSPPLGMPATDFSAFIALSCRQLWKTRNAAVFRNETHTIDQVIAACRTTAQQWRWRFPRKKQHIPDQWCQILDRART